MKNKVITINPKILSGTPVFTGTRVPIKTLFDYLETDETIETFLNDFPSVKREQATAILEIAEKLLTAATETLHENIIG